MTTPVREEAVGLPESEYNRLYHPPSIGWVIGLTLLLGPFGAIPTFSITDQARRRGFETGRYWKAFAVTLGSLVLASILMLASLGVLLGAAARTAGPSSNALDQPTATSAPAVAAPTPAGAADDPASIMPASERMHQLDICNQLTRMPPSSVIGDSATAIMSRWFEIDKLAKATLLNPVLYCLLADPNSRTYQEYTANDDHAPISGEDFPSETHTVLSAHFTGDTTGNVRHIAVVYNLLTPDHAQTYHEDATGEFYFVGGRWLLVGDLNIGTVQLISG